MLQVLTSRRFRDRSKIVAAAWIVSNANWSGEQRETISQELCKSLRWAMSGWSGGFGLSWLYLVYVVATLELFAVYYFGLGTAFALLSFAAYMLVCLLLTKRETFSKLIQARVTLEALSKLADPTSLGTSANATKHAVVRDAATSALAKITANLRPEHFGAVPNDTVPSLCNALDWANTAESQVILNALAVIGDGRAIKTIERLSQNPPTPEIGTAALELLPILRQREIESKAPAQLLRAGSRPQDKESELLRAVAAGGEHDPNVLLRASVGNFEEPK